MDSRFPYNTANQHYFIHRRQIMPDSYPAPETLANNALDTLKQFYKLNEFNSAV